MSRIESNSMITMNTARSPLLYFSSIRCKYSQTFSKKLNGKQLLKISLLNVDKNKPSITGCRQLSAITNPSDVEAWCESSDQNTKDVIAGSFRLIQRFITEDEATNMLKEAESYLKKIRYEYDHWDNAIHGFRETEKSRWNDANKAVLHRVREVAFQHEESPMTLVHVLDLAKDGYIKPHIDSIKFCGSTITGLSLMSPSIMKLVNEKHPEQWAKILLEPRSLYIMTGQSRYNYTHEILKQDESMFQGKSIARDRRISIMCRNEPT